MNAQWTNRVRLVALATAGLAIAGAAAPVFAGSTIDNRPVQAANTQVGPGNGSQKTPAGVLVVATPLVRPQADALYFHASNGQAVQQTPISHSGPGLWSPKSPNSDRLNSK